MDYSFTSNYNEPMERWDIKITGEIDIFSSEEFKKKFLLLMNERQIDLNIDCEDLNYIDSTTLGVLVSILKEVKLYNGSITLTKVKSNLVKLFRITNLDKVFLVEGVDDEK